MHMKDNYTRYARLKQGDNIQITVSMDYDKGCILFSLTI